MGRKHGQSEYQRSFLFPSEEYAKSVQEEMYTYRCIRRQKEAAHSELKWGSSETGSSDNSGAVSPVPSDIQPQDADDERCSTPLHDGTPTLPVSSKEQRDSSQAGDVIVTKQDGPLKRGNFRKVKKRKTVCEKKDDNDKPPFVTYGWADRELNTARKLTHNVKANREYVYPAALKKKKLHQLEKRQRVEARAESRASIAAALVCRNKVVLNDVWMTEYQRCYSRGADRSASNLGDNNDSKVKRPMTR